MIIMLCGADTYRSRKKMRDIRSHFYAVAGNRESAYHISLAECSRADLEGVLGTGSLFREKRLVVLEEPSEADTAAAEFLASKLDACASSDDVFVVWDRMPQKNARGLFATILSKAAKVQEFSPLASRAVNAFIEEESQARALALSAKDKRELAASFTGNTWLLIQNMETRGLGGGDTVRTELRGKEDPTIFSFTDAFGLRARADVLRVFYTLLRNGVEAERLFWALIGHLRALVSVASLMQAGVSAAEIPQRTALHPFVVKKAAVQTQRFSLKELTSLYTRLTLLDFETKQSHSDMALGLERILLSL